MKLLRVGDIGREKVAALDANNIMRDLSSHIEDLNPENLIKGIDWTANKINKENNDNKVREKIIDLDSKVIAKEYINLYSKILKKNAI